MLEWKRVANGRWCAGRYTIVRFNNGVQVGFYVKRDNELLSTQFYLANAKQYADEFHKHSTSTSS